jgi:DNA-binding PadR family transcriptional regulator
MARRAESLLLPSSKEALILELLKSREDRLFGLELVELSEGSLKRGTVYVTLQRMEEKGLIGSEQEPRPDPQIGIPRRRYKINGLGERALNAYRAAHEAFLVGLAPAEA